MIVGYFKRWLHCLWWLMPWKIITWVGMLGAPQHCGVTKIHYSGSWSTTSIECECGRIFWSR